MPLINFHQLYSDLKPKHEDDNYLLPESPPQQLQRMGFFPILHFIQEQFLLQLSKLANFWQGTGVQDPEAELQQGANFIIYNLYK